jgi:hypothetical protein
LTTEEFAILLELLIERARDGGLSDEAIIARLEEAAEALNEGLSPDYARWLAGLTPPPDAA